MPSRPVEKICAHCGAAFFNRHKTVIYCCRSCAAAAATKPKTVTTCHHCGISFSDTKHRNKAFCSRKCFSAARIKHQYVCEQCGKPFHGSLDGNGNPPRSCTRSCYDQYRIERRRFCSNCGSRLKPTDHKFCCHQCRVDFKKPQPRPCVNCGNVFSPIKFNSSAGRIVAHDGGKTCSAKCENAWIRNNPLRKAKISAAFKGNNHPNWQGGKAALSISTHRGSNWLQIAERARKRDHHKCQRCGKTQEENGRKLDVHHITPYHDINDSKKANRLSNLISLCKSCHRKEDNKVVEHQIILPFAAIFREERHVMLAASGA